MSPKSLYESPVERRSELFLGVSARLTGFGRVALLGTGMTAEYLRAMDAVLPAGILDELLDDPRVASDAGIAELLDDTKLGPVARNLILLWYCGTWTRCPTSGVPRNGTSPLDVTRVESAAAYQAGLQWVAAGAHPGGRAPAGLRRLVGRARGESAT